MAKNYFVIVTLNGKFFKVKINLPQKKRRRKQKEKNEEFNFDLPTILSNMDNKPTANFIQIERVIKPFSNYPKPIASIIVNFNKLIIITKKFKIFVINIESCLIEQKYKKFQSVSLLTLVTCSLFIQSTQTNMSTPIHISFNFNNSFIDQNIEKDLFSHLFSSDYFFNQSKILLFGQVNGNVNFLVFPSLNSSQNFDDQSQDDNELKVEFLLSLNQPIRNIQCFSIPKKSNNLSAFFKENSPQKDAIAIFGSKGKVVIITTTNQKNESQNNNNYNINLQSFQNFEFFKGFSLCKFEFDLSVPIDQISMLENGKILFSSNGSLSIVDVFDESPNNDPFSVKSTKDNINTNNNNNNSEGNNAIQVSNNANNNMNISEDYNETNDNFQIYTQKANFLENLIPIIIHLPQLICNFSESFLSKERESTKETEKVIQITCLSKNGSICSFFIPRKIEELLKSNSSIFSSYFSQKQVIKSALINLNEISRKKNILYQHEEKINNYIAEINEVIHILKESSQNKNQLFLINCKLKYNQTEMKKNRLSIDLKITYKGKNQISNINETTFRWNLLLKFCISKEYSNEENNSSKVKTISIPINISKDFPTKLSVPIPFETFLPFEMTFLLSYLSFDFPLDNFYQNNSKKFFREQFYEFIDVIQLEKSDVIPVCFHLQKFQFTIVDQFICSAFNNNSLTISDPPKSLSISDLLDQFLLQFDPLIGDQGSNPLNYDTKKKIIPNFHRYKQPNEGAMNTTSLTLNFGAPLSPLFRDFSLLEQFLGFKVNFLNNSQVKRVLTSHQYGQTLFSFKMLNNNNNNAAIQIDGNAIIAIRLALLSRYITSFSTYQNSFLADVPASNLEEIYRSNAENLFSFSQILMQIENDFSTLKKNIEKFLVQSIKLQSGDSPITQQQLKDLVLEFNQNINDLHKFQLNFVQQGDNHFAL